MNSKSNFSTLIIAVLLIIAGIISPSNGVDSGADKSPVEILTTMLLVIFCTLTVYIISNFVHSNYQLFKKSNDLNTDEN